LNVDRNIKITIYDACQHSLLLILMSSFLNTFSKLDQKEMKNASLIMMCGLPGSGKSSIARKLAKELNIELCISDKIRKKVFKNVRYSDAGDLFVMGIRKKYYAMLSDEVAGLLKDGKKVVIDASNMDCRRKEMIDGFAKLVGKGKIVVIEVRTSKETISNRMKEIKEMANDNEDFETGWRRVHEYFEGHLETGKYFWPTIDEGVAIVKVNND